MAAPGQKGGTADHERYPSQSYPGRFRGKVTPTEGYIWQSGFNRGQKWVRGHWRAAPGWNPTVAKLTTRQRTAKFGSARAGWAQYNKPIWTQHKYYNQFWKKGSFTFGRKKYIKGIEQLGRNLQKAGDIYTAGAYEGFMEAGKYILEVASETIPWDTGFMNSTGFFKMGWKGGVEFGYHATYATFQHENLQIRHKAPRRAKWLELTLREQESAMFDIIAGFTEDAF